MLSNEPGKARNMPTHKEPVGAKGALLEAVLVAGALLLVGWVTGRMVNGRVAIVVALCAASLYVLIRLRAIALAVFLALFALCSWVLPGTLYGEEVKTGFGEAVATAAFVLYFVAISRYKLPHKWRRELWNRWGFRVFAAFVGWWLYVAAPEDRWRWTCVAIYAVLYVFTEAFPFAFRRNA